MKKEKEKGEEEGWAFTGAFRKGCVSASKSGDLHIFIACAPTRRFLKIINDPGGVGGVFGKYLPWTAA